MKDFNGNELVIGDTVAFLEPHYRHMCKGTVVDFTKKMIRVEYLDDVWIGGVKKLGPVACLREPGYVAKIVDRTA